MKYHLVTLGCQMNISDSGRTKEYIEKLEELNITEVYVKDKDHVHIHLVTNSVSYEDGRKLHQTKKDLQKAKDYVKNIKALLEENNIPKKPQNSINKKFLQN